MKTIGLEEHFATPELIDAWQALDPQWQDVSLGHASNDELVGRLLDVDADRIAAMDETGLDVAVVSMTTPGLQNLTPADAVALQGISNDRLADAVRRKPDRLQGFATLATPNPEAAAAELERAVTELGFNGAMLYGRTRDRHLDHPDFWPIFEAAEALNAPLYLHPQSPPPAVRGAYYSGLGDAVDAALATHGLGWHYDAGLPGGVFSQRYLQWSLDVVGPDRILFATDYPYVMVPDGGGRRFLEQADIGEEDRQKIASGNRERLCAGIRR